MYPGPCCFSSSALCFPATAHTCAYPEFNKQVQHFPLNRFHARMRGLCLNNTSTCQKKSGITWRFSRAKTSRSERSPLNSADLPRPSPESCVAMPIQADQKAIGLIRHRLSPTSAGNRAIVAHVSSPRSCDGMCEQISGEAGRPSRSRSIHMKTRLLPFSAVLVLLTIGRESGTSPTMPNLNKGIKGR